MVQRGFTLYPSMASLIRTWRSDLFVTRSRHFWRGNIWVRLYPRMKTFLLGEGASTSISAPRSYQLGHQVIETHLAKVTFFLNNIIVQKLQPQKPGDITFGANVYHVPGFCLLGFGGIQYINLSIN